MNKKGVIHFSAAPDFSFPSTFRCDSGVCACGDVGDGDDIGYAVCGGCAVGSKGEVSGGADIWRWY